MNAATRVVGRREIEAALGTADLVGAMEAAFVAYSAGRAVVPPVGELLFPVERGEAHIKFGHLLDDATFVVKIATGFYNNPQRGLPAFSGLVLVFDKTTGVPAFVLLDEGHLTNLRTAAAGAVAAKYLARPDIGRIAVLGSGVQARLQLEWLGRVTPCRDVALWARNKPAADLLAAELDQQGWRPLVAASPSDAAAEADLIVTATASETPLLRFADLRPGTHVTAVGSDTPRKQELDVSVLAKADIVVADSIAQCLVRGEIHHAVREACLDPGKLVELGAVIAGLKPGRRGAKEISVADLTGVAVQDIAIANTVLKSL